MSKGKGYCGNLEEYLMSPYEVECIRNIDLRIVNIGREFLSAIKGSNVVCLEISYGDKASFALKVGYTKLDFLNMLSDMFRYNYDVIAGKTLSGYIWCEDGSWFEREYYSYGYEGEYHIYEWVKRSCPDVPESLL